MTYTISKEIKEKAPLILAEIQKARSILLHCHPSPDPDSVGSALAMKFAIEQLGKKATVIKGDSEIPQAFMYFPGAGDILMKSFWEIDPTEYDLFIILDSSVDGVSRLKEVILPESLKVINIDHHRTNASVEAVSIVDPTYPATAQLLFDILKEMNIIITPEIAINLFMGIFTDTGGFKYRGVTPSTFEVVGELAATYPDFARIVAEMENSDTLGDMAFRGLGLSSIFVVLNEKVALSVIPCSAIEEKNIPDTSISASAISSILRKMGSFEILGALVECRHNKVRLSFRSGNSEKCDVSKLAAAFGGGGHKGAAGATLEMPIDEAKKVVVEKIKELYNL